MDEKIKTPGGLKEEERKILTLIYKNNGKLLKIK
tara:strand:+ start:86 stop:187 length:102 start_codon:yes stop_codon:yes gene_type:complete